MCDNNAFECVKCLIDAGQAHKACTATVEVVDCSV